MTKKEAIDLENEVDKIFSEKLGTDCEVSMTLTGTLRISADEGFFNINTDKEVVDWVKWNGDYQILQEYINKTIIAIRENKEKVNLLLASYRMKSEE